jgi:monovalent cation/hydrogen antiporter
LSGDTCEHVHDVNPDLPAPQGVCEDCVKEGTSWVHLRQCSICGHVACCDSSVRRHARRHWHATGHAIMHNAEAGPDWMWCYEHNTYVEPDGKLG